MSCDCLSWHCANHSCHSLLCLGSWYCPRHRRSGQGQPHSSTAKCYHDATLHGTRFICRQDWNGLYTNHQRRTGKKCLSRYCPNVGGLSFLCVFVKDWNLKQWCKCEKQFRISCWDVVTTVRPVYISALISVCMLDCKNKM